MTTLAKLSAASSLALLPALALAQTYSITDLQPASPFPDALAYGLSQNGKITGVGTDSATGDLHAFIYDSGVFQDLGTLGYPYGADGVAINDSRQVAATGYGPGFHAFLWTNGQINHLGSIDGGYTEAFALNNLGHVVGRARNGDGGWQAFTWFGSFATPPIDIARGLNDSDQVAGSVGYYWTYGGYIHGVEHACTYINGAVTELGDLGGGPRTFTEAYAINNSGQVTGYSTLADGTIHAFLYSGGVMSDLGTFANSPPFYTYGHSINSHGDVLGSIETYVGGPVGNFLYTDGVLHDFADLLDSSGAAWSDLTATQINDAGWIVGYGTINGEQHGFLARPAATACFANCDASTTTPILNVLDFACFLNKFAAGDPNANCDNSTTPPILNVLDFTCFLNRFAAGCP